MKNLTKHTILTIFLALIGLVSVMGEERPDANNRSIIGVWKVFDKDGSGKDWDEFILSL